MKIITLNINGIRSAYKKGFFRWMLAQDAEVVCLQETKAQVHQLSAAMLSPQGYLGYFNDAEKRGYSGVALFAKRKPDNIKTRLGWFDADSEGRYIQADFGRLSVISLYLPSGSSSEARQTVKFDFMRRLMPVLKQFSQQNRDYIICGDWNIAHKEIDLKNWRGNRKNSGFLPEERAWMDKLFGSLGWVDAFRTVNQEEGQYTWWSNRGQAWHKNVGWRIDYQVITPSLRDKVKSAEIFKAERFSDHAPLTMVYNMPKDIYSR